MVQDMAASEPAVASTATADDAPRIDRDPEPFPSAPVIPEETTAGDARLINVEVMLAAPRATDDPPAATPTAEKAKAQPGFQELRSPVGVPEKKGSKEVTSLPQKKAGLATRCRSRLKQSAWYHSKSAKHLRRFLTCTPMASIMMLALFAALFMPDVWTIAGVNDNIIIDAVLTVVMFLFVFELFTLSAVDSNYFLSFFWFMDILGTVSMVFDISYLASPGHTDALHINGEDTSGQDHAMLLRATRAAKVGARAGRISRMLRFLKFIPFFKNLIPDTDVEEDRAGIAKVISAQLVNLLATRVACLTIILIMAIPLFDVWTFPQQDLSLSTWAERLSVQINKAETSNVWSSVQRELKLLSDFYESSTESIGPYQVCVGSKRGEGFQCDEDQPLVIQSWSSSFDKPPRGASELIVSTDILMISYNMHDAIQLDSGMSMATIFFIIFVMVGNSMALSRVVDQLAVRPLERMLSMVRDIASTVFKLGTEIDPEMDVDENEVADIDNSNEMKLLEKVVQKLAVIAELQTRNKIDATGDMADEDLGVLGMMEGSTVERAPTKRPSSAMLRLDKEKMGGPQTTLKNCGLTQELHDSIKFAPFDMTKEQKCALGVYTISSFAESGEGFVTTVEDEARLLRFVEAVEKEYPPNIFHNFNHAIDVVHGVARTMRLIGATVFLSDLDQYSLLVAAIGHDLGHPGVNNGFLSEVGHELALEYNDKSPLENMHCAKLYTIVGVGDTNVFAKMSTEQYKEARKNCIETILHTDMVGHQGMVKDLQKTYLMNAEVFQAPPDLSPDADRQNELEVFNEKATKMLAMEAILHSADVSNPCKDWNVTKVWAGMCVDEFFAQGDQEKLLGVPVQFLNDRDKLNRPNSQIGFIEFMIAPFFVAQIRLWPALHEYGDMMANNISRWADLWEQEVNPAEEERNKVRARVERVKKSVEDAKDRATA